SQKESIVQGIKDISGSESCFIKYEDRACQKRFVDHVRHVGVGEDDNRRSVEFGFGADFFEDIHSVHLWQHQIQQDGIWLELVDAIKPALPIGGDFHLVAFLFEAGFIDARNDGIVFDNEYFFHNQDDGDWTEAAED